MTIQRAKEILTQFDKDYSDEDIAVALEFLESLISLLPEYSTDHNPSEEKDFGTEKQLELNN
ncbi:hypothetical protein JNM05_10625 [bacterium]|nr:hypothetical protein [bacterium]